MAARAYRDMDIHLRTRLLARIAAGARLSQVCAEAGAPSYASVRAWARAEPEFAAALARARADGQWRRDGVMDEARAGALLARLAAGEGIVSVLRDPAMPSRRVYRLWRAQYGWFAEEVFRIRQARRGEALDRCRARRRAFDPVLADRIVARVAVGAARLQEVLSADPALPGRPVVIRWRRERPDFDFALRTALRGAARHRRARRLCAAVTEAVCARVRKGETLAAIGRRADMPCAGTLYGWMRKRPEFREAVTWAWRERADGMADRVVDIAEDRARAWGRGRAMEGLKRKVGRLDGRVARWAGR